MMKADLDWIMGQLTDIGELVRFYQSGLSTVGAKSVQNILNKAYIDIEKITKEK